jgi:hypothetical protein
VKREINTGDARPVRKQPYRLAYPLEPIVEEQGNEMNREKQNGILVENSFIVEQSKRKDEK